ncbi:hypothetical protein UJ101_02196 [Flavobacteriaceae bacterium UJ101]|nr:hypothetical protein UJ101_02196 [Flavobacteriaceae bacterium UJ101]
MLKYFLFLFFCSQLLFSQEDSYIINNKVIRSILEKSDQKAYELAKEQLKKRNLSDDDKFDCNWVLAYYFIDRNEDSVHYYFSKINFEQLNPSQSYLFKCLEHKYFNVLDEESKALEVLEEAKKYNIIDPFYLSNYLETSSHILFGEFTDFKKKYDFLKNKFVLNQEYNIDYTKSLYEYYNLGKFMCLRELGELKTENSDDYLKYLSIYKKNNLDDSLTSSDKAKLISKIKAQKLYFMAKSDSLAKTLNDKFRIGYGHLFNAIYYFNRKNYTQSLKNADSAIQILNESHSRFSALGESIKAENYYETKNYEKAKYLFTKVLNSSLGSHNFYKKVSYNYLAKIAEKENNINNIKKYYKKLNQVNEDHLNKILNSNNEYLRQKLKIKEELNEKVLEEKNYKIQQNKKYKTVYFIFSFMLLLGLLFLGLYSYQLKMNASLTEEKNDTLQKYNENLKTFTSVISHDLKSPLSSIINLTQLLMLDEISKDEKTTYLDMITKLSNKSIYLINELRAFYKMERGDYNSQHFTSINLYQTINETHDVLFAITDKNMTIENNIPHHINIQGIKVLIMELFQNLIENAIKYSKKDADIVIEIYLKSESETAIEITIKDYGIGILPKDIPLIFNKDKQIDSSKNGLGLGLNFCKKIMDTHKGKIECISEYGNYTEFNLTFKNECI